eukprot:2772391-Karenia_brevis.AAC.1
MALDDACKDTYLRDIHLVAPATLATAVNMRGSSSGSGTKQKADLHFNSKEMLAEEAVAKANAGVEAEKNNFDKDLTKLKVNS